MEAREIAAGTSNPGKLREFRNLLRDLPLRIVSLEEGAGVEFPEEGDAYEANAVAKARAVSEQLGVWGLADDSGLEVVGLDGGPGPFSARFGGPGLDDEERVDHLLKSLDEKRAPERRASFVCVAVITKPSGEILIARGECPGKILDERRGGGGFGYDPVFLPDGYESTMAEIPAALKDRISHRGRAFARLRQGLLAPDWLGA
jgi:XTP/dITP diphosphohydrolase